MRMMINQNLVALFFFMLTCWSAQGQTPYFQSYVLLKKNEPVQINAIFQDKKGFMWFGTNKGLFKFNGKNYQRFTKADSLPDENVTAIGEDAEGRIWAGHNNGNLSFFENGKFQRFETQEGPSTQAISDIVFDKQGVLWFSTRNDGLYYYLNNRLYRLDEMENMPDLFVYDLLLDSLGNVWAGTDGGVAICSVTKDSLSIDVLDYKDGLPDNIVKKLVLAKNGTVWMATEDAGIILYDPHLKVFKSLTTVWNYGAVNDFVIGSNSVWIATSRPGLVLFEPGPVVRLDGRGENVSHFTTEISRYGAFAVLFKDREGSIWGGSKAGIIRTDGDRLKFINASLEQDLNVLTVTSGRNGALWYATSEGLFKRTENNLGVVKIEQPLEGTRYAGFNIISLFEDSWGYIWAGLYGEGVLRINPDYNHVQHYAKELRNGNVLNITGRGDTIWLATLGGIERVIYRGPDDKSNKYEFKNFNRQSGLSSDFVYQVFVDSKNRVWLATDGKGVDMIDEERITHFGKGLPTQVVYGFAEDSKKQIWANVQGNGIYRLEGDTFHPPDSVQPLRDTNVSCFAADAFGNLVIMHDLGIDVYNPETKQIRYFDEGTGIRNWKANLNALAKGAKPKDGAIKWDAESKLYIGTDGGIIEYNSDEAVLKIQPQIAIEHFKVFDQHIPFDEKPVLRHNENGININFYGLWYQNPESLQFQYKMDNYDQDWIATGDNDVTYSRLPAGEYVFRVRVSSTDDFSAAREASVSFRIKPPFWQTPLFYALLIVVFGSLAYSIVKYRERKLKEDKLILEHKVEERTMEIQRKTEEIQAQNEEIISQAEEIKGINENLEMLVKQRTAELEHKNEALAEYAFINAHKLRGPLASILGCIHLISKTKLDEDAKEINTHLQQRADELDDIVREITKAIERGDR
jgi:ligand-binding sensor domain-containing protein